MNVPPCVCGMVIVTALPLALGACVASPPRHGQQARGVVAVSSVAPRMASGSLLLCSGSEGYWIPGGWRWNGMRYQWAPKQWIPYPSSADPRPWDFHNVQYALRGPVEGAVCPVD